MVFTQAFEPVTQFLEKESLNHFVSEHHSTLVAVGKQATVGDGMQVLQERQVLSVPVLDEDGEYAGCFSVADVLRGLVKVTESFLGQHYTEHLESLTEQTMLDIGQDLLSKPIGSLMHEAELWLKGDEKTNLMTVLKEGFRLEDHKVHHRIFICDPAKSHKISARGSTQVFNIAPGSEKLTASSWRPTDVVSQYDVIKLLYNEHKETLEQLKDKSLESMDAFLGSVVTVPASAPAIEAFHHMAADHKSCLGIVDADGTLIGNLSMSDLRSLRAEHFPVLLRPVAEYVLIEHGLFPVADALAGKRPAGAAEGHWKDVLKAMPVVTIKPSNTFVDLLETIIHHKLHRIYIVDDHHKPVSLMTLTDVLRVMTRIPAPGMMPKVTEGTEDMDEDDDDDDEEENGHDETHGMDM